MSNNMELWDKVCKTDPSWTKRCTQRGGFTTIDAQFQLRTATEQWGPYGQAWGLKNCVFTPINDYDVVKKQNAIVEMALDAVFFYPGGEFQISTDIGYRPNSDTRKKLMTGATTKALSKLGFNSDVFEGKFDDNQYVAEMREKFGNHTPANIQIPTGPAGTPQPAPVPTAQPTATIPGIPGVNR